MLGELMSFIIGVLTLVGAGLLSYTFLGRTSILPPIPKEVSVTVVDATKSETPVVVVKKEIPKQVSVPVVEKKAVVVVPRSPSKTNGTIVPKATTTEKTVVAPGPLRATTQTQTVSVTSSDLTIPGVIEFTNGARSQNGGLPALTENEILDRDAKLKMDDMFTKQYFEHISPQGVGPADLAQIVGYAYIVVGENLALGDFGSDQGVVTAWMNSPGHRANILNPHYQEIGVAVGKGMYEGHMTWIAVQSFGMPLSACPAIDTKLKAQLDADNITISNLRTQLDTKKAQIDVTPTTDSLYNTYVTEFNAIVPQYNTLVETSRVNVSTYNAGVQTFNACIAAASTH